MEERRLLLAVALSLLVLTGYQLLFPPKRPPRPTPSPSAAATTPATLASAPVAEPQPLSSGPVPAIADDHERRVEAQGADLAVAFTNRGARLVSWRLARFTDAGGRAEEMVESVVGAPRPLDIETGDPAVDERLRGALFRPSTESLSLSGPGPQELRFEFSGDGLKASKTVSFPPSGYLVSISASVQKDGRSLPVKVLWGPGVGNPTPAEMEVQGYQPPHAVALTAAGVERPAVDKVGPLRVLPQAQWAGVESHYFAALFVPPPGAGTEIRTLTLPGGDADKPRLAPQAAVVLPGAEARAGLYVGPKDYPTLAREGHDLAKVVPVGEWIGPIVVPLMKLLNWVHGHVGNYGWSIVALTVLINVAMSPLRHYSIANGVKMAKLSPEMKVIQERYRKVPALDPKRQEMQKEIAALYERHGMSMGTQMAVGCLPLLLTMPFLIAFYRVLQVSIELRGSPFLWIPDLSQKDPLFVTPVLMGISMFAMQRMTPSTMDPAQQRMMMIMPLVLVVMFFAAPSGLNLYWLASNLCSIIQQGVTLRLIRGSEGEPGSRDRRKK
jgi:YidC/Oxa1 family membrane protein insertase